MIARVNYYTLFDAFGVIAPPSHLFTPLLWVSLGLLVLSVMRTKEKECIVVLELIFLAVAFHFYLTLFQQKPRVYDSYVHYGTAEALMETGHLNPADFSYLSWPGAFLWASVVTEVLSLPGDIFLYSFPVLVLVALTLTLYVISRSQLRTRGETSSAVAAAAICIIVYFAENNSLQTHFSPQAIGLVLTIFLAYVFFSFKPESIGHSSGARLDYVLMSLLFFASITITHPPSALIAIFAVVATLVLRFLFPTMEDLPKPALVFACLAIFLSWHMFEVYQFAPTLQGVVGALALVISGGFLEARYVHPVLPANSVLSDLTILRHSFFFTIAVLGFFLIVKSRDRIFAIVSTYGGSAALLFGFLVLLFRGFLWDRVLLFGAFPVALSVSYVVRESRPKIRSVLLALVFIFFLINAYNVYANEAGNMVPTSERQTALFTVEKVRIRSFTGFVEAPLDFLDPYYVHSNVEVFYIDEYPLTSYANPSPGICSVIVSGQLRILVGDAQFLNLTAHMNNSMNRYYSTDFDVSYSLIKGCN